MPSPLPTFGSTLPPHFCLKVVYKVGGAELSTQASSALCATVSSNQDSNAFLCTLQMLAVCTDLAEEIHCSYIIMEDKMEKQEAMSERFNIQVGKS